MLGVLVTIVFIIYNVLTIRIVIQVNSAFKKNNYKMDKRFLFKKVMRQIAYTILLIIIMFTLFFSNYLINERN